MLSFAIKKFWWLNEPNQNYTILGNKTEEWREKKLVSYSFGIER